MGPARAVAARAHAQCRGRDLVLRPPLGRAAMRLLLLWNRHGSERVAQQLCAPALTRTSALPASPTADRAPARAGAQGRPRSDPPRTAGKGPDTLRGTAPAPGAP